MNFILCILNLFISPNSFCNHPLHSSSCPNQLWRVVLCLFCLILLISSFSSNRVVRLLLGVICGWPAGLTSLKKIDTPSTSSYQMQIAPILVVAFHAHLPLDAGILVVLSLHRSRVCCHNCHLYNCLVVSRKHFHCSHPPTLTFTLFCSFLGNGPWALWEKGMVQMPHLGLNTPQPLIICIFISCGSLCSSASPAKRSFSNEVEKCASLCEGLRTAHLGSFVWMFGPQLVESFQKD